MTDSNTSCAYGTPGFKALKGLVVGLSTLTTLCGVIFIGLGLVGIFSDQFSGYPETVPAKSIGVGLVLFFISFLGCFGTFFENKKLLHSYFVGFMVLVLVQAIALIVVVSKGIDTQDILNSLWDEAYSNSPRVIRDIQNKFECCGFNNVFDRAMPKTHADSCTTSPYYGYTVSCYSMLSETYRHNYTMINIALWILILLQGVTLAFTWILSEKLPHEQSSDDIDENSRLNYNNNSNSQNYGA